MDLKSKNQALRAKSLMALLHKSFRVEQIPKTSGQDMNSDLINTANSPITLAVMVAVLAAGLFIQLCVVIKKQSFANGLRLSTKF